MEKEKQSITIMPATYKLLEFLTPREIPTIVNDLNRVFDNALFNSCEDIQERDKTALFTLKHLTELITNLYKED